MTFQLPKKEPKKKPKKEPKKKPLPVPRTLTEKYIHNKKKRAAACAKLLKDIDLLTSGKVGADKSKSLVRAPPSFNKLFAHFHKVFKIPYDRQLADYFATNLFRPDSKKYLTSLNGFDKLIPPLKLVFPKYQSRPIQWKDKILSQVSLNYLLQEEIKKETKEVKQTFLLYKEEMAQYKEEIELMKAQKLKSMPKDAIRKYKDVVDEFIHTGQLKKLLQIEHLVDEDAEVTNP